MAQTDFGKTGDTKFHENLSSLNRVILCGWMDKQRDKKKTHGEENSSFLQICDTT
jgi:hypothetical protein